MEILVANLSKSVRRETLMGRKMIVAPVSLIAPGILNGSRGPIRYAADDIEKSVDAWNGMPIVVYHPKGDKPSGRSPDVLNKQGVGHLYNVTFDKKLKGEVWIDEEIANSIDNRIVPAILKGEAIEVSTGLNLDSEPAEDGATENGVAYIGTARNYRPDHLAILPDVKGACSIVDGCGINNAESGDMSDKKSAWIKLGEMFGVVDNAIPKPDVAPAKACEIMADGAIQGHELTDAQKGMFGAICGKAKKTENCECGGECEYCKAGESVANAAGMSIHELQDKLYVAFGKLYPPKYTSDSDEVSRVPYIVDVYDKYFICSKSDGEMYRHEYTVKDGEVEIDANAKEVKRVTTYEMAENESADSEIDTGHVTEGEPVASPVINEKGTDTMALTAEQKKATVDNLIAWNCECGKVSNGPKPWAETDRETLNALPDEKLMNMDECRKAMTKNELVANAAKDLLVVNADGTVKAKEVPVANAPASPKPMTEAEWFASAPPMIVKIVENAKAVETREKNDIVTRLVANVAENERQAVADRFMAKSVEDLRDLDKLIPRKTENTATRWTQPDYTGASAPVGNAKPEEKCAPLYTPPMIFN